MATWLCPVTGNSLHGIAYTLHRTITADKVRATDHVPMIRRSESLYGERWVGGGGETRGRVAGEGREERGGWRERERERERDRGRDRWADRQARRETERQIDRQTDRQTNRQAGRQIDRQTDRQTDTDADTDRHTDRQTEAKNVHER